jgi:hypothetical protein
MKMSRLLKSKTQWFTIALFLTLILISLSSAHATASVQTDKSDYSPGDTVTIYGSGFAAGATVTVTVVRPDGSTNPPPWTVTADSSGEFTTTYQLDGIIGTYTVTATDETNTATTTFTDKPTPTTVTISFSPSSPVTAGTSVTITGTVTVTADGTPVTAGTLKIDEYESGSWVTIGSGTPDSNGQFGVSFDTTGLGGTTIGFRSHYVPAGGSGYAEGMSDTSNLVINSPVTNVAPVAEADGPYAGNEGSSISFTFSCTDTNTGDTWTATANWGDGSPVQDLGAVNCNLGAFSPSPSHTYDDNGAAPYTITLTVKDSSLASGSDTAQVSVNNVAPTATFSNNGPVDEGSPVTVSFSDQSDPSTADAAAGFHYAFSCSNGDLSSATYASSGTSSSTSCTFNDNGSYDVKGRIIDKDDGYTEYTTTVTVNNVAPTPVPGGPYSGDEGSSISFTFTCTDPGINDAPWTASVDWADGGSAESLGTVTCNSGTFGASHTYADNGGYTGTLTVTDKDGDAGTGSLTVTVSNVPPTITSITCPIDPVQIGTAIAGSAQYTDPGIHDTQTATWDWGDTSTSPGSVIYTNPPGGSGSVTGSHTYTSTGLYTVSLQITDKDGGASDAVTCFGYVVVYDPNGGFVTGGGWINSPAGAYTAEPSLTGKATFGFVSKYQKGANVPMGNTEFQFHAGDLNFKSTAYDWLVVAGTKAQFKGTGTINGAGNYGFMLTAVDGGTKGGDMFRIKIWDKGTGTIVYDNQMGASETADPTTLVQGGSIVVHK